MISIVESCGYHWTKEVHIIIDLLYMQCKLIIFVVSLQLEKTNEEQKRRLQKTERALKVAEVC